MPLARKLLAGLCLLGQLATAQAATVADVEVRDYRFTPAELTVKVGDTVRWTNQEKRTSHSVIFSGEPESERFFPGESWQRRFDQPGRHDYRCGPHPEMRGTVIVVKPD